MIKTEVEERTAWLCGHCGLNVSKCFACGNFIDVDSNIIYCRNGEHYCVECGESQEALNNEERKT